MVQCARRPLPWFRDQGNVRKARDAETKNGVALFILGTFRQAGDSMHFHYEICVISCFSAKAVVRYDE
jgi:hypothetical protein